MRDDIDDQIDRAIGLTVAAEYENRYREAFRSAMVVGGVVKNHSQVMLAMSRTAARAMQTTGRSVDPTHLAYMASFLMEELNA